MKLQDRQRDLPGLRENEVRHVLRGETFGLLSRRLQVLSGCVHKEGAGYGTRVLGGRDQLKLLDEELLLLKGKMSSLKRKRRPLKVCVLECLI